LAAGRDLRAGSTPPRQRSRIIAILFDTGRGALNTIAVMTPTAAPRALRAWLDAAVAINSARGVGSIFDFNSVLVELTARSKMRLRQAEGP
jgi:hypothetical protein